jgi:predicted nucleic acid-binding protein
MTPLTVTVEGVATHPEDDLVLATAVSGGAQFLVTGDHRLLALREYEGVVIVSVREFLALLPGLLSERPEGTR